MQILLYIKQRVYILARFRLVLNENTNFLMKNISSFIYKAEVFNDGSNGYNLLRSQDNSCHFSPQHWLFFLSRSFLTTRACHDDTNLNIKVSRNSMNYRCLQVFVGVNTFKENGLYAACNAVKNLTEQRINK